tara:strand:+ start:618 stop:1046 length:429 start_codon:yes stop_codon:yes gene_type:complete
VRGIDGDSRNNKRPCGVAEAFQVRKHRVEAHADVPSNIFSKHPSGPELVHEPIHFRPEVAVIFRASALPSVTEWLAWVSAANNGNWSDITQHLLAGECANVLVYRYVGPMLFQHLAAKGVVFAESYCLHTRSLQAQGEAADS